MHESKLDFSVSVHESVRELPYFSRELDVFRRNSGISLVIQEELTCLVERQRVVSSSLSTWKFTGTNITIGLCIVATILIVVVRGYTARKSRNSHSGSLADLVRRGQLNSDRGGISTPLKYDDPFNNPMIKVSKNNSTVEMCGKAYRLAPATLTGEQQTIHQKRRSRHTSGRDQQYFSEKESQFLLTSTLILSDGFPQIIPLQLLQVILTKIWLKIMCTRRMVSPSVSRQNTSIAEKA